MLLASIEAAIHDIQNFEEILILKKVQILIKNTLLVKNS